MFDIAFQFWESHSNHYLGFAHLSMLHVRSTSCHTWDGHFSGEHPHRDHVTRYHIQKEGQVAERCLVSISFQSRKTFFSLIRTNAISQLRAIRRCSSSPANTNFQFLLPIPCVDQKETPVLSPLLFNVNTVRDLNHFLFSLRIPFRPLLP
ncbi:hypothetical protein LZ32DRAFT_228419 [Colletotrichum eremochloae]|nr:hypothetical protein LZ32DRAFT_228419 [Colletotrichum eremochloae]